MDTTNKLFEFAAECEEIANGADDADKPTRDQYGLADHDHTHNRTDNQSL